MAITTRDYLKFYSKDKEGRVKLRKLFTIAKDEGDINEVDYWLLLYAYVECRMVYNTCAKFGMSKGTYHNNMNVALAKIDFTIRKYNKIWTF